MAKETYIVLNDGDTFSPLSGCLLVEIDGDKLTPEQKDMLDNGCMAHLLNEDMFPVDTPATNDSAIGVHDLSDLIRPH